MLRGLLKKIVPSYRVGNVLQGQFKKLENEIYTTKQMIEDSTKKNEYLFWLSQKRDSETLQDTKRRVFLEIPRAEGTLRDLQLAELHLLVRLKEVCDANHFMLCLAAGTMLGAVRHHGFIPWDDDIDTYMMRDDALKLFDILKDDKEIAIHHYYRRSGDHIIKLKYKNSDNIFIDIFTFDRIDCTSQNKAEIWSQTQDAAHEYENRMIQIISNKPNLPFRESGIPTSLPELDKYVQTEYDPVVAKMPFYGHGDSYCESIYDGWAFRRCWGIGIFHKDELFPLLKNEVEFEGIKFDAFRTYPEMLEREYGDIWSFPERMFSHHLYEIEESLEETLSQLKAESII